MEISEITYPIFIVTRICGLTPMSLKRDLKGRICGFRRNIAWLFYSVGLFLTIVYLMYRACINDSKSEYPIRLVKIWHERRANVEKSVIFFFIYKTHKP